MPRKKTSIHPSFVLIQGTLHPLSHTAQLLEELSALLSHRGISYNSLDLRKTHLDIFDGRNIKEYGEATQQALLMLDQADVMIFSVPAYAPKTPGALKNLISLASSLLTGKRAGLICYSETGANYEASLDCIRLLSVQNVEILKPIIHATRETFRDGKIFDEIIVQLIDELIDASLAPSMRI